MATTIQSNEASAATETSSSITVRTVGFPKSRDSLAAERSPQSQSARAPAPSPRPAPRPRPKGRLFVSLVLLTVFGSIGMILWNEFVRYAAYGTIEGRVLSIAVPWSGQIEELLVADGQYVEEGQVLARIHSAEMQLQLAKLDDEIRLAKAALETRVSELRSRDNELAIERIRSKAEYDQLISQLQSERSKLDELQIQNRAFANLEYRGIVPQVETAQNESALLGQKRRVDSLEQAADNYLRGLKSLEQIEQPENSFAADTIRLDSLLEAKQRLDNFQKAGEIRSPVTGRVVSLRHFRGEFVELGASVMELVQSDSLRTVLYVRQSQANRYFATQHLELLLPPNKNRCEVVVDRIDDELREAPHDLARYFRKDERLVAVIAKPIDSGFRNTQSSKHSWLGAEVRQPHSWSWWLGWNRDSDNSNDSRTSVPQALATR